MARPLSLKVDGAELRVAGLSGREAVGELFRLRARVITDVEEPAKLVGKPFELELSTRCDADPLRITGIVVRVEGTHARGAMELALDLGPDVEVLAHGRASRVHLAMTSSDIVKKTLSLGGFGDTTIKTSGSLPKRPTTTQYRESDWEFALRIAAEDGLFPIITHGDATELSFTDDSTKATSAGPPLLHSTHTGLDAKTPCVTDVEIRSVVKPQSARLRDRDPEKPKLALDESKKDGAGAHEVMVWPGRFAVAADGAARAGKVLEALRADRVIVSGVTGSLRIRPGMIFEIEEALLPTGLRKLFCVSVELETSESELEAYRARWTAVPADVRYRLPWSPAKRAALGPETTQICGAKGQEIDVDASARVFAQPLWDRDGKKDEASTARIRTAQVALGHSMAIPRIGWPMLAGTFDGDIDRAWTVALLYDGKHRPPYKLPDEMTRTAWQTLTSPSDDTLSELSFDDKADAELIKVAAARDMNVAVGDNEARTVGNRHVLTVEKDRTVKVGADHKVTVAKQQETTVKGNETTTIDGSRSITVKGKESVSIGGSREEEVTSERTVDVGKARKLTVGASMKATAQKSLTREVLKKLSATAAGAWTTQADGGLVVVTKGDGTETVAGAYTQNAKEGIQTLVKGDLSDTVAAAATVTAQGSVGESAKGKMKLTVGAAMTATAPGIEIVAESEITIACGPSTIKITSSEVAIKGPTVAIAGPVIASSGAQVKHNP